MLPILDERHLKSACDWLIQQDPALKSVVDRYGYPPLWNRPTGFASLVHIILEQQVSLESARAAYNRLQAHLGAVTPAGFLGINDDDLLRIGFSRQKKAYVRHLSTAIVSNTLNLDSLSDLSEPEIRTALVQIKGIGDWTVDIYLVFCMLHPDVLPKGDIALYEAIKTLKNLNGRPGYEYFEHLTEHWRPWRSVGARLLWHFYLCERGRQ